MSGQDGRESCSLHTFQNERHIVSCVALAQWTYARCAGDDAWLAARAVGDHRLRHLGWESHRQ